MCGICGWYQPTPTVGRSVVRRMVGQLQHRGPDHAGYVEWPDTALGMSRLRVIDVKGGDQPIASRDKRHWIVYNGEVYNFRELRAELEARGRYFATRSDTEVVLQAFQEWGPECVRRFNGMFAFCIAEGRTGEGNAGVIQRLFLARDKFGKKPLYYHRSEGFFAFASEIKSLLQHPAVPREVNRAMLPFYLVHGYVPSPGTMFAGIHELPPGNIMTITPHGIDLQPYWALTSIEPSLDLPYEEAADQVREVLATAVKRRMVSDVPLGAFLSGGVDSAAVVALMAQASSNPIRTFTVGFASEGSYDETAQARELSAHFGTDHHEFILQPNVVELLPELVWYHDQPFADSSAIPTYLISQAARTEVTVVLTGDGGDEAFAGYDRFRAAFLAERYRRIPSVARRAVAAVLDRFPQSTSYYDAFRRAREFSMYASRSLEDRYLGWVAVFPPDEARSFLPGEIDNVERHYRGLFNSIEGDMLRQLLYVNAVSYLPGDLLVKADRSSMAHGLELRSPFLDPDLMSLAWRLPSNFKLRRGRAKAILRHALKGVVPDRVLKRKKHGFGVPVGTWLRTQHKDLPAELLLDPVALRRGYFDAAEITKLIDEHVKGKRNHGHRLWALMTLEEWHRQFIDPTEITPPGSIRAL